MKRYKTIFIFILSSVLLLAGCTDESLKEGGKVSLSISAVIPVIADSLVTRADTGTGSFKVALSATANSYADVTKDYTATGSGNSYTFSPAMTDGDLKIAILQTTTPLTIYGQVGDIPYYCSVANATVNRGTIADVKLTYAYAKIAVRVLKAGKVEAVENYTVSSNVLSQPKTTDGSSYDWNTSEAKPKLVETTNPPLTKNTNKGQASNLDCSNADECMAVTPVTIAGNTEKLFTLTEASGNSKTYNVSALTGEITIEAGYVYLFTIDLDKEAVIIQTDITPMDKDEFEFRSSPGLYTLQDLLDFRDAWNLNGENGIGSDLYAKWMDKSTLTVKLLIDIDLGGESWTPIKDFTGTFEGGGHTISNLTVTDASDAAGLFGTIKATTAGNPAIIQNLNVENATVSSSSDCGVICGKADNSRITGCNVSGVVVVNTSSGNAGGIVGNVTSGSWLQRCNALCLETSSITGTTNAGGIVGNTDVDVFGCVVNNISTIEATNVGCIVGTGASAANLYSCIASNITTLTGNGSTSPFGNATASDCYFTNVTDNTSGTGYVKYMEYMNGHCDLFNNALYTFYQSNSGEPYQAQYKFVGGRPSTLPPTLIKGEPQQQLPRTSGIYTGHELAAFAKAWNSGESAEYNRYRNGSTVTIMNDIDMREITYTAINTLSGSIIGANSQQQTVANLNGADALVNSISSSLTIKDLILKDAVTTYAGFVVNIGSEVSLRLEYCRRIGGTTGTGGGSVGGLVSSISHKKSGSNRFTCIACSVEDMTFAGSNVGGILGYTYNAGTVIGCTVANIQSNTGSYLGGFLGNAREYSGVGFRSCIIHNLNFATGTRGIFVGTRNPSDPRGTSPSFNYCLWNGTQETTNTVGSQNHAGQVSVSNCNEVISWNEEALQTLNNNLGQSGYEWQLQEGRDYPIVVRTTN